MNLKPKAMKIEMKNGYVMIKDAPIVEERTESGLILPKMKYQRVAEVVAVPEGSSFHIGEKILKPIGHGTPVKIDGVEYECVKEDKIFARL